MKTPVIVLKNAVRKQGFNSFLASIVSILAGLLFGLILLLCFNPADAPGGFVKILITGFSSTQKLAKVFYTAAPLVLTGLSVGFAFKTGLFNIGATGQYLIGAFMALYGGIVLQLPWWAALLMAMAGGAIWGAIPGICKAFFNVNEVITSIMFNWIGLFLVNLLFSNTKEILGKLGDRTAPLSGKNSSAIIPKMGLDKLFNEPRLMNISIFIAIFVTVIIYIVLDKTTFGYELKACGFNRHASLYAGINAKRNIVLSMVIAGALAGISGGIYYLSGTVEYNIIKELPSPAMGFNGIPVALLAMSNPIGIIFSALFVACLQVGGDAMQPEFAKEVVDIIIAAIIYLSAFSLLMRGLIARIISKRKSGENVSEDNGQKPQKAPPASDAAQKEVG